MLNMERQTRDLKQTKIVKTLQKAHCILFCKFYQMKSWAGEALETVNCFAFLKRRLVGAC
jgi:hypothetical protein